MKTRGDVIDFCAKYGFNLDEMEAEYPGLECLFRLAYLDGKIAAGGEHDRFLAEFGRKHLQQYGVRP